MLHHNDSVSRLMNVLVDSRDGSNRRLLLPPLACQSVVERNDRCDTGASTASSLFVIPSKDAFFTVKRFSCDAFIGSTAYFRQQCDHIVTTSTSCNSVNNNNSISTVDNAATVNRTDEGYLLYNT